MNKAEVIELMAKHCDMSKVACRNALEAFIDIVEGALKKNKSVVLTRFGTFEVMKRKERVGVNPATGAKMKIAAKKVPKFKPGKQLKELVA
jgi:DNA-binding protein HU-beta